MVSLRRMESKCRNLLTCRPVCQSSCSTETAEFAARRLTAGTRRPVRKFSTHRTRKSRRSFLKSASTIFAMRFISSTPTAQHRTRTRPCSAPWRRCGRKRWLWWLYTKLPPFAFVAELIYRLYAANRKPVAMVRRIWYGKDLKLPTYHIASTLFLRLLGAVYLIAFVSLWTQVDGLIGDHGILPVKDYLDAVEQTFSQAVAAGVANLEFAYVGMDQPARRFSQFSVRRRRLALDLIDFRFAADADADLAVGLYLSLVHAGQIFWAFNGTSCCWKPVLSQSSWHRLVWRSKFLADRHPPRIAIWLVWWLLFRLMFESGAVKLTWNTWDIGPMDCRSPTRGNRSPRSIFTTGRSHFRFGRVGMPRNSPSGFKNCRWYLCWSSSWEYRG